MILHRMTTATAVIASLALGAGVGAATLLLINGARNPGRGASIEGVVSGVSGAVGEKNDTLEGVDAMPPVEHRVAGQRTSAQDATIADSEDPQATTVEIEGVEGADGTRLDVENTIQGVAESAGSIQAVRGIEGIDAVMLENLEMVLRMQQRPEEQQGKGGARSAASLLSSEPSEEFEATPDDRDIHLEFELEGS